MSSYFAFVKKVEDVRCKTTASSTSDDCKFIENCSQDVRSRNLQSSIVCYVKCCQAWSKEVWVVATHIVQADSDQHINEHTAADA